MSNAVFNPRDFSIAPRAKTEIAHLRVLFEKEIDEKSDVVMIGWGEYHLHDGHQFGSVVVSFYTESQRSEIESHIVIVDAMEIVFFTIPKYYAEFEGKTLQFEAGTFCLA